uniref:Uncharacterized protein n=1 Tax=Kalanchoe fedtschenkoi TaxID=63787 RepID=A0A7N0TES7_KALFE
MLPKNLLQSTVKKMFHVPSSCCSATRRKSKGASSFSDLSRRFDAAGAAATNDHIFYSKCTANPQDAVSSSRTRNKGANKKVKIRTLDPKSTAVSDQGDDGGRLKKAMDCLVLKKLEEMKLMDKKYSEHSMDIEEVMYYYSLITSQTYQEIVDKFFVDLYLAFSLCRGSRGASSFQLVNV